MRRLNFLGWLSLCGSTLIAQPQNGFDINSLTGVDEFGRTINTIAGTRPNRYVGMFYFLWLGQHASNMAGIYDNTKILAADQGDPYKNLFNIAGTPISPYNQFHFWGEPLYHYYTASDEYVLRRHVELLTAAGIDFLWFDVTNGWTYDSVWMKLCAILDSYQREGWNVPKIAFLTNSYSETVMTHLYDVMYSKDLYSSLWFRPDGVKPLIIGKFDNEPAAGMEQTIRDFFCFRTAQWPNERALCPSCPDTAVFHWDGWPWIDWQKPQRLYGGGDAMTLINVSPAQHPMIPFSDSYLIGSLNWGRGFVISYRINDTIPSSGDTFYRYVPGSNDPAKVRSGGNFEQEWKLAIATDPQIVTVTGWNQWVALKQTIEQGTARERIAFVDAFSEEYSNDLEPMLGGYEDAFYMQMIQNIRKYKGIAGALPRPVAMSIDIRGDTAQWNAVTNIYRSIGSANYGRNSIGFALHGPSYTLPAPRNNLQEIRVTNDAEDLYFLVRAENAITPHDSGQSNWMNLLIGTNQPSRQGWEGYRYVVNRNPSGDSTTSIERLDSAGNGTLVGRADYSVMGNKFQLRVPRAALELTPGDSSIQYYFKVADGVQNEREIMDYYVTGKSVPLGRLSFSYMSGSVTSVGTAARPWNFSLSQNFPNPFNPSTEIRYSLSRSGLVTLKVYDLLGREVAVLADGPQAAGEHTVRFGSTGLASGIYVYRLQAEGGALSRRMILLR
jgi:hypothetical protein